MNFLIIDTSTDQSFAALHTESELIVQRLPPVKQSQSLLPAVEKLLENEEIAFIAVGTGPGAFTGTRVGVMAAKTLAFALGIPILPFCSLKIFTPDEEGPFTLVGDAKSRGSYLLKGIRSNGTIQYEPPYLGEKRALSSELNLPFLATYLQEKFQRSGPLSHREISVSYLIDLEQ